MSFTLSVVCPSQFCGSMEVFPVGATNFSRRFDLQIWLVPHLRSDFPANKFVLRNASL